MAKRPKNKKPKQRYTPSTSRTVRQIENPANADRQTVSWRISRFDWGGAWGDEAFGGQDLQDLIRRWASDFE